MRKHSPNRRNGNSIAELPVNLWVFFVLMLLPFIDFVTLGCRATFAYFGVRDATYKAALQPTFGGPANNAPNTVYQTVKNTLGTDEAAWTGISYSNTSVYVVQVDAKSGEKPGTANTPWTGQINSSDVYLIRVTTSASASPLLNLGAAGVFGNVPGLTGPVTLLFTYQVTAETPQGLIQG